MGVCVLPTVNHRKIIRTYKAFYGFYAPKEMKQVASEVFNRYEKKYIITDEIYQLMKPQLEEYMEVDDHSRNGDFYTICNIYYDTPDSEIIRKSIEGPVYKEKLRLRSYGVVEKNNRVYLEIKKKFDGCVNKRRTSLTLEEAYHYLDTRNQPEPLNPMNGQILNEIDFLFHKYKVLQPKLFLAYDRNALFGIEDKSFRVTFDTNIRTRRYDLVLDKGIYGELLLPKDQWLMEVKMKDVVPLWFAKLLSKYKVYPVSFSKYGMEYQRTMAKNNQSHVSREYIKIYA
jgi:hypothetical protein